MKSNRKDQKDGSYKERSKMETMLRDPSPRGRKLRFMKMVAQEGQWLADRERKQQGRQMKTGYKGLSLSLSLSRCFSFFRRKGLRDEDKRDPIYWGRRGENGERLLQVAVSSLLSTPPSHPMPMPPVFFYVYMCFACISFSFFTKRKIIYFSK